MSRFTKEPGTAHRSLKDFISVPGVYPVGRLDQDSEGLLLLTDDGALKHRFSDPRFEHPRIYWAQVEGIPASHALTRLCEGVEIQGLRTRPAVARMLGEEPRVPPRDPPIRFRKAIPTSWIELTLTEGRNRQVRRMTAAVGHPTLRLLRIAIGHLRWDGLDPGQWRDVEGEELRRLLRSGGRP